MGLIIENYPLFNGVEVPNLYCNIRDVNSSKENGMYILEYTMFLYKEDSIIKSVIYRQEQQTTFNTVWVDAYVNLKGKLDDANIIYSDDY